MQRVVGLMVLGVCICLAAGCGGSSGARGYLYRYGNGEAFIQWEQHGHHVHGTISDTQSCCVRGPARLNGGTLTVNGRIAGSNVLLHVSNGGRWWRGTLHPYGLLMSNGVPGEVGVRYQRASVADYNAAVAQTKAAVERMKKRQAAERATTSAGP